MIKTPVLTKEGAKNDDIEEFEITQQIEGLENVHVGLKDMHTMSEMTKASHPNVKV